MRTPRLLRLAVGVSILLSVAGCGGGGASSGTSAGNALASVTSIDPSSATIGSSATTLIIYGSNFSTSTEVFWNGTALTTTYVNNGELTAAVPASDLAAAANVLITVSNSGSAAGASAPVDFLVANPKPELAAISPQAVTAGDAVTLTATGTYFLTGAQILWNGSPLNTTAVNATTLSAQVPADDLTGPATVSVSASNPGPGGGASPTLPLTIYDGSTRMVGIQLNADDIVWDATHGLIYASVPGTNGTAGYVEAINPVTAKVTAQVAAGSNPNQLAISSADSELWVGEDGIGSVERFSLPGLKSDLQFTLPKPDPNITQTALSLQAAPGSENTLAVLLTEKYDTPDSSETVVYDGATPRPATVDNGFSPSNIVSIAWGADATVLYGSESGCESVSICDSLDVMPVESAGVSLATTYSEVFRHLSDTVGFQVHFDPSTSYLYANDGLVANPVTGDLLGSFNVGAFWFAPLCTVDSAQGLVFFLGQTLKQSESSGYTIEVFDQKTYRLLGSLLVPSSSFSGMPTQFIRWGSSGLAFTTDSGRGNAPMLYLVDGKFVNGTAMPDVTTGQGVDTLPNPEGLSPQSAVVGSGDLTVTITGTDFTPGAQAYWGYPASSCQLNLQTTYISPTELQAIVPACHLESAGVGMISISNGTSFTLSGTQIPFTVFAAGSNPMVMNLDATSLAWDKKSGLLYAAVSSLDPQYPNSIVAINPATGAVVKSQAVGSNSSIVRITADGTYLYVGHRDASLVTRLQLPGLSAPFTWPLGTDPANGPILANDVEPGPGASQTAAVAGNNGAVSIFDNGIARSNSLTFTGLGNVLGSLQWGPSAAVLYGSDTSSALELSVMGVDASGLSLVGTPGPLANATGYPGANLHFDPGTGFLYDDDGVVFDPAKGTVVGQYNTGGIVAVDSSLNTVFILSPVQGSAPLRETWSNGGNGELEIASYDQKTFAPIGSMTLSPIPYSGISGSAVAFVRCGASCLAFATVNSLYSHGTESAGMLYILNDPSFVTPAPAN